MAVVQEDFFVRKGRKRWWVSAERCGFANRTDCTGASGSHVVKCARGVPTGVLMVSFKKQIDKPWRLLGFGYFQTWMYLFALSPALIAPGGLQSSDPSSVGIMLSGFLCISVLVVVVGNAFKSLLDSKPLLIGACLIGGLGTVLMIWAPGGDPTRVLGIGLADAGTAVLALWWGKFWSVSDTERMSWHLVISSLFSCVLYLILVSLPSIIVACIVPILPLLSAGTLLRSGDEPHRMIAQPDITILPSVWKLVAAFIVIPLAYSLIRAFFAQGSLAVFGAPHRMVMVSFAIFALILVVVVSLSGKRRAVTRLYRTVMTLMLLGFISLMVLPSDLQWMALGAVMLCYPVFEELIWLMKPEIKIVIGSRTLHLFGWGKIVFRTAAFFGVLLGTWLLHQTWIPEGATTIACMIMTGLVVILSINVLTARDFSLFLDPIKVENVESRLPASESIVDESCRELASDYGLSKRETEVFLLLARGRSLSFIEGQLFISNSTARTHTRSIYRKLDVHTKQALIDLVEERCSEIEAAAGSH